MADDGAYERMVRAWSREVDENNRLRAALSESQQKRAEAEANLEAAHGVVVRLREALERIAANTCCDRCNEAALVARAALAPQEGLTHAEEYVAECNAVTGSVPPMDDGPWHVLGDKVSGDLIGVSSDDFKRDVLLRVDGDFGCAMEKADYCAWLARTLNLNTGHSHCPHCGQWHRLELGC